MSTLILDPELADQMIAQRQAWGVDRYDEVWDGVYVMVPLPNNEHQSLVGELFVVLSDVVRGDNLGIAFPGVNISDQKVDWRKNYRCPDVVVFLKETKAINCETHWYGPPDFVVEIISPNDQSREKLSFYEKIGTREVLLIDRDPWQLELYSFANGKLDLVGTSNTNDSATLISRVMPLQFQLMNAIPRPEIRINSTNKSWKI